MTDVGECSVKLFVPKPEVDVEMMSRSTGDRVFVAVNERPVVMKELKAVVKKLFGTRHSSKRWPYAVVLITVTPDHVDVNLEPNKEKVLLQDEEGIISLVRAKIEELYCRAGEEVDDGSVIHPELNCESLQQKGDNSAALQQQQEIRHNISSSTSKHPASQQQQEIQNNFSSASKHPETLEGKDSSATFKKQPALQDNQEVRTTSEHSSVDEESELILEGLAQEDFDEYVFPSDEGQSEVKDSASSHEENCNGVEMGEEEESTPYSQMEGQVDMEDWSRGIAPALVVGTPVKLLEQLPQRQQQQQQRQQQQQQQQQRQQQQPPQQQKQPQEQQQQPQPQQQQPQQRQRQRQRHQ